MGSQKQNPDLERARELAGGKLPKHGNEKLVAVECPRGETHAWLKRTQHNGRQVWCLMPTNWTIDPETGRGTLGTKLGD